MEDQEVKVVEEIGQNLPAINEGGDTFDNALPKSPTVLEVEKPAEEKKEEKGGVKIGPKDYAWLRKNHYDEIRSNFKTTFILQHKKFPDKIVELKAASAVHACRLIHWKPQQVRLLGTKESSVKDEAVSSTSLI